MLEHFEQDVADALDEELQIVLALLDEHLSLKLALFDLDRLLGSVHDELCDLILVALLLQVDVPHVLQLRLRGEDLLVQVELHE